MSDSHTCDICGEVRACGLLCACERGETSKATELAALKAENERMTARVKELEAALAKARDSAASSFDTVGFGPAVVDYMTGRGRGAK